MEYLIGAAFGAAATLLGFFAAKQSGGRKAPETQKEKPAVSPQQEALLRQWNNLLSYSGREQHDED